MAFNALKQSRSAMYVSVRGMASSAAKGQQGGGKLKGFMGTLGPDFAPIAIVGGMVGIACCIAVHTAKQQLLHSPSVQVTKMMREQVPEVDNPDAVIKSSGKFESKSFLRKIAHIQDEDYVPSTQQPNREMETLKSVGIDK